ncbi:DNA helicase [Tanacetum coccineum]
MRKLLPKTNNVESSENPISIPSNLDNHDESLHTSIPSDLDNHDESSHIRLATEPCEVTTQVVRSDVSGQFQLLNSSCDSPVEGGQDSASNCFKRKLPASSSCDAFSRYSQLCGRNVLVKCSLDVPPASTFSNFGAVEHSNLEVFEKYSDMCRKNTVTRLSTPSVNVVRDANVVNSQPSFSEPLRLAFLNVTEGVGPSHDRANLNAAAEEVSSVNVEGCSSGQLEDFNRVGVPRATNRRNAAVMRDDGEGCSYGQVRGRSPEYYLFCGGGQIYMQPNPDTPEYFKNLLENKHFMESIKAYNQMFAMTYFGAKVDESINWGRGPYVFKVSGQIYHWIGSLCTPPGESRRFLQLYIYDTNHEVENRLRHFGSIYDSDLDSEIVEGLIHFLDAHNQLVQLFRTARDKCREIHVSKFKIRLYNAEGARGYELSTSNTLGAVVFDSGVTSSTDFDVIIQEKDGLPKRINKLHKSYRSFQFPLLFFYGQAGFHTELKLGQLIVVDKNGETGRLFQQYVVGGFCAIEQNRLDFILKKQKDIRGDHLLGLYDAISKGEQDGYEVGGRIILPMSFTGGLRSTDDSERKIKEAQDVDRFISAELPDPKIDPQGYRVVSEPMMHGPCHVHYQRRDTSISTTKHQFGLDNSYVVPYNRALLLAFEAYINVKYCGWSMLIKYIFKYISNGTDRIFARVSKPLDIGRSSARHAKAYLQRQRYEVSVSATSSELRFVFSHILIHCDVANPSKLWRKYWAEMGHDIPRRVSERVNIPNYHLNDQTLQGYTLYVLEIILSDCGKSFQHFGLTLPPQDLINMLANKLLMEENNYNQQELMQDKDESVPKLNTQQ